MNGRSGRFPCAANHFVVVLTVTSIVIVIAEPSLAQADPEELLKADIEKRSNRQTYCGSHLVDALHLACGGFYNPPRKLSISKKKKNIETPDDELTRQQETDSENWQSESNQNNAYDLLRGLQAEPAHSGWIPRQPQFPFRERLNAHAYLSHGLRRSIRGVHDECCAKSCAFEELRAYCAT